jgi:hypothetical protein
MEPAQIKEGILDYKTDLRDFRSLSMSIYWQIRKVPFGDTTILNVQGWPWQYNQMPVAAASWAKLK